MVAGLPELQFDEAKLSLTLQDFREELKSQLSEYDYNLASMLFLPYDHQNILKFLQSKDENFNSLGNFSPDQVAENHDLPLYLTDFIEEFKEKKNESPNFIWDHELTSRYYNYIIKVNNDFLRDYFLFDLHLNNILTAYYSRKHDIDFSSELVGDDFIIQQLRKSPAKDFGLSSEFPDIEKILQIADTDNLVEREKKIDLLRWDYIDENTFSHYFTIEKVLGYLIQLMIILRWIKLDKNTGREMFRKLVETMKNAYEFPDEFKVNR